MKQFDAISEDSERGGAAWLSFTPDEQELLGMALTHYNQIGYHQAEDPLEEEMKISYAGSDMDTSLRELR